MKNLLESIGSRISCITRSESGRRIITFAQNTPRLWEISDRLSGAQRPLNSDQRAAVNDALNIGKAISQRD